MLRNRFAGRLVLLLVLSFLLPLSRRAAALPSNTTCASSGTFYCGGYGNNCYEAWQTYESTCVDQLVQICGEGGIASWISDSSCVADDKGKYTWIQTGPGYYSCGPCSPGSPDGPPL